MMGMKRDAHALGYLATINRRSTGTFPTRNPAIRYPESALGSSAPPLAARAYSPATCPFSPDEVSVSVRSYACTAIERGVRDGQESVHATVAALMGLEIHEGRIDRPDVDIGGQVSIAGLATVSVTCEQDIRSDLCRRLLAALAGPVFVGRWESARWPLDENEPGDVGLVARYCRLLDYDAADLLMAESRIEVLLRDRSVRLALSDLGSALLEHGAIPGHRVEELVAQADVDPAVVRRALLPLGGA